MAVNFITAEKRPATDEDMWLDEFQSMTMLLIVIASFYSVLSMRYQPDESWSEPDKQKRRELLDHVEQIARIAYLVIAVLVMGFLFWEVQAYSADHLSLSDHLHSRPAMIVFAVIMILIC